MSRPNGTRPTRSARPAGCKDHRGERLSACDRGPGASRSGRRRGGARGPCRLPAGARHPPQATRRRHRPIGWSAALRARWAIRHWRRGYALLGAPRPVVRSADALVASRRGGGARARFPGHADHPEPHRPALGSQRGGARGLARGDAHARRRAQRRVQDLGPGTARPAVDGREQRHGRAGYHRDLRRRALHVREQLPGRQPGRRFRHDLRWLQGDRRGARARPSRRRCCTTMRSASIASTRWLDAID